MQSKVMIFFLNFMKNDIKPTFAITVAMVTGMYTEISFTEPLKVSNIFKFQGICRMPSKGIVFFVSLMQKEENPCYFEFWVTFLMP